MTRPRIRHTSTLLTDGTVLIAGGYATGPIYLSSAETFDPAEGRFVATSPMAEVRAHHTATLLRNGKVLIAGGMNASQNGMPTWTAGAELYDPVTRTFTATDSMLNVRANHTATLLTDGRVLITGGDDFFQPLTSAEIYDPATGMFSTTDSLDVARAYHTATLLRNGNVLVAGGGGGNGGGVSSAEVYVASTGTFHAVTSAMSAGRDAHAATMLPDGRVLLTGGSTTSLVADLYDSTAATYGSFSSTASLSRSRVAHSATLLPDGTVLVAGTEASSTTDIYDPSTGLFTAGPAMTDSRAEHSATLLPSGRVLLAGGYEVFGTSIGTAELFDRNVSLFAATGTLPAVHTCFTATLLPNSPDQATAAAGVVATYAPAIGAPECATVGSGCDSDTLLTGRGTMFNGVEPNQPNTVFAASCEDGTEGSFHSDESVDRIVVRMLDGTRLREGATAQIEVTLWAWSPTDDFLEIYFAGDAEAPVWSLVTSVSPSASGQNVITADLTIPSGTRRPVVRARLRWNGAPGPCKTNSGYDDHDDLVFAVEGSRPAGQVLVTGGACSGGTWTSYLYDVSGNSFTPTVATLPLAGVSTATLLPNGKVLLIGGATGTSAYLYDPLLASYQAVPSMPAGQVASTATLLGNGKVLVTGKGTAVLYDPGTGSFSNTGSLLTPRTSHTATLLRDGRVLILGGFDEDADFNDDSLSSAEIYDPGTGQFTATGNLVEPRVGHQATVLPSGMVLVTGGLLNDPPNSMVDRMATAELYDPATGTFALTGEQLQPRAGHAATVLPSGLVLLTGGIRSSFNTTRVTELYDPATRSFTSAPSMAAPRTGHRSVVLPDGNVFLVGGLDESLVPAIGEVYLQDIDYGDWRPSIATFTSPTLQASAIQMTGSHFTGWAGVGPEGGGGSQSSASNHPMLLLQRIDSGEQTWVPASAFNAGAFTSSAKWMLNPGPALAFTVVNGVPSAAMPITVTCGVRIDAQPQSQTVSAGAEVEFSVAASAAFGYQWQRNPGQGSWVDIPGATASSYRTAGVTGVDAGSQYRVVVSGNCGTVTSSAATIVINDAVAPVATVLSPAGGEYWLLSPDDGPATAQLITWSMSDNVRVCGVTVSLLYSDNGGASYQPVGSSGGLPVTFGSGTGCVFPGESVTSFSYTVPKLAQRPPGSLYKIQLAVTDQAGNTTTVTSASAFYMVEANDDSVQTLILWNSARMQSRQGVSSADITMLEGKLRDLAGHPRVQGVVVDLAGVTTIANLSSAWDADPDDPTKANAVLFGTGGIQQYLRSSLLPAYTGVKYLVIAGDDRIIPMARLQDRTVLLLEGTYANDEHLSPTATTVGQALASNKYLSDDPLAVLDGVSAAQLDGSLYLPDLAVGRLVETPQEIVKTIATYIAQDGVLDLTPPSVTNKVLIAGYDILSNAALQMRERWKSALGDTSGANSTAPVDGTLVGGTWGGVEAAKVALRTKLAGNGGSRFGIMALAGHATHYEEGVPGVDFRDIQGLSAVHLYGPDACSTPTQGAIDLAGGVIYAAGCHGGLPVPGSCAGEPNPTLDVPQTMLSRGAVAYVANTGYGWSLKEGIGYSGRLLQIFTEQFTSGGTVVVGDAVRQTKQRYYLEAPRYDAYDEKTLMQWTLFGLPMYAVRTGIAAGASAAAQMTADAPADKEQLGAVQVTRKVVDEGRRVATTAVAAPAALPSSLTQLNLSFDFTAAGVYTKHDSAGNVLAAGSGCPDPEGCYYTLNGLVDRGTGSADTPIEPYLVYDSRLAGTSQHGVLWKGGVYDEESNWKPVIAELVSNGGDGSNHGSLPRLLKLRPTGPRVTPGADLPQCRPSDLEVNTLTIVAGEALKPESGDAEYSISRRYRNVDLEVFYFNNRTTPAENCDRTGPELGTGPFGGAYHQVTNGASSSTVSWNVPVTDGAGVWRVLIVYSLNTVNAQGRGSWTPLDLTTTGNGVFTGNISVSGVSRLTYVVQAVDNRGNVTWLDYQSAQLPASGVNPGVPNPVDVVLGSLSAPTNVIATAATASSVSVTWSAVTGATGYDVYRSASGNNYTKVGSSTGASFTDSSAIGSTAYLYTVKAVDSSGVASSSSAPDLATTVVFTDPGLTVGTPIRAAHVTQLRTAVNAVRTLAGLQPFAFSDSISAGVTRLKLIHITQLRSALDAARSALSLPGRSYTDGTLTTAIPPKAAHIVDLRNGVR